jgi:preprotein translocase subunit SecG
MYTLLTILVVIACLLLMLIVLIQNPKGSGLSSAFGGSGASNQMMGVQRTTDILEKATWALAIFILVASLFMNYFIQRGGDQVQGGELERELQQTPAPAKNLRQNRQFLNVED